MIAALQAAEKMRRAKVKRLRIFGLFQLSDWGEP